MCAKKIKKDKSSKDISSSKINTSSVLQDDTATGPQFGEKQFVGDPTAFKVSHPSDTALYAKVNNKLLEPIPKPRDPNHLVLNLDTVYGDSGNTISEKILKAGQIVFHAGGDTGPIKGPQNVDKVTDKLFNDFVNEAEIDIPYFFFHLGDVVYSFGESQYYYDQFYDPFRNYPAPILAIAGNHDGLVYRGDPQPTLDAFLRNFVSGQPEQTPEAGGLIRTSMIQPGVYFAFDVPFVTIMGLYSNVLEDPGVISSEGRKTSPVTNEQLDFLLAQLNRVKNSGNAVIVVMHHPPYAWGSNHGGSPNMSKDIDHTCKKAGFWPHAILSGHAHNYQRFTRTVSNYDIPYIVCGNSGHNVIALKSTKSTPLRAPSQVTKDLIFENYDDTNYGYLRIVCNNKQLRIEYHDADPNQKSYSDAVTIDLKSHTMISN
jgi:hypothetical protein